MLAVANFSRPSVPMFNATRRGPPEGVSTTVSPDSLVSVNGRVPDSIVRALNESAAHGHSYAVYQASLNASEAAAPEFHGMPRFASITSLPGKLVELLGGRARPARAAPIDQGFAGLVPPTFTYQVVADKIACGGTELEVRGDQGVKNLIEIGVPPGTDRVRVSASRQSGGLVYSRSGRPGMLVTPPGGGPCFKNDEPRRSATEITCELLAGDRAGQPVVLQVTPNTDKDSSPILLKLDAVLRPNQEASACGKEVTTTESVLTTSVSTPTTEATEGIRHKFDTRYRADAGDDLEGRPYYPKCEAEPAFFNRTVSASHVNAKGGLRNFFDGSNGAEAWVSFEWAGSVERINITAVREGDSPDVAGTAGVRLATFVGSTIRRAGLPRRCLEPAGCVVDSARDTTCSVERPRPPMNAPLLVKITATRDGERIELKTQATLRPRAVPRVQQFELSLEGGARKMDLKGRKGDVYKFHLPLTGRDPLLSVSTTCGTGRVALRLETDTGQPVKHCEVVGYSPHGFDTARTCVVDLRDSSLEDLSKIVAVVEGQSTFSGVQFQAARDR